MNIAIFPNTYKNQSREITAQIAAYLKSHKINVYMENEVAESFGATPLAEIDPKKIDFMITLGGDGTILRAIHNHFMIEAPILAINMGSLGFMADITLDEIYPSLQDLLEGNYNIQYRMMMEGDAAGRERCYAVNEMVVHRAQNPSLIDLELYVDGKYLNTFSADGIIIATPTGSTAYSLAAGGPIVTPDLEAFIITPISPHTISNRPIVLLPKQEITIRYSSSNEPVEVTYDGFLRYSISSGEEICVHLSKRKFPLISMLHHDFFSTLRKKLGWTGKVRAFPPSTPR